MPKRIYTIVVLTLLVSISGVRAQKTTIDSLQSILRTLPDDTNRVNNLIELCYSYSNENIIKMIEIAHEALACAKRNNYEKGISQAYGLLGGAYSDAGNNHKAIEYYLESLRIAEERKDLKEMALNYHDIGTVYVEEKKFEEGLRYYQRAIAIWQQAGNKKGLVTVTYNIGYAYQEQGKDSIALKYYDQAVLQGEAIGHNYVITTSMINMSAIYLKHKDYNSALKYIEKANRLAKEGNLNNLIAEIYGIYSDVYLAQGINQKALSIAEEGLVLAKKVNIRLYVLQNYKRLATIYQSIGNSSKAYDFLSYYMSLNDTLKNEESRVSIEHMVHSYELEKKDLQLTVQSQQYESGIFRRNVFIGSLFGFLLLGFLMYNRTKLILASKQRQLKHYTQSLLEKSAIISTISEELEALKNSTEIVDENMEKFTRILHLKIHTEEDWENFKKAFEEVYPNFFTKLRYKYPTITASELRLAAITKLNLSIKEAATMLGISVESVKQSRYRLKKRMEVPDDSTLKNFL